MDEVIVEVGTCRDDPERCRNHSRALITALNRSRQALEITRSIKDVQDDYRRHMDDLMERMHQGDLVFQRFEQAISGLEKFQRNAEQEEREERLDRRNRKRAWVDMLVRPAISAAVVGVIAVLVVGFNVVVYMQVSDIKERLGPPPRQEQSTQDSPEETP